jgi:hypothetical protein
MAGSLSRDDLAADLFRRKSSINDSPASTLGAHYLHHRTGTGFIGDENARLRSRLPLMERSRAMIIKGLRLKQTKTFEQRLIEEAKRFEEAARDLPPGMHRDLCLRRARQAETASHLSEWLKSPRLNRPTL